MFKDVSCLCRPTLVTFNAVAAPSLHGQCFLYFMYIKRIKKDIWNSSLSHLIWPFWIFSMFLSGKKVLEALDTLSSGGWAERWVKAINLLQAQRGWIAKIASKNLWNLRGNEYSEAAAGWLHVLAWNVLGIVFRCFAGEWSCIPKDKLAQVLLCHSCLWGKSGVPSGKISFSLSLPFFGTFCECSFC